VRRNWLEWANLVVSAVALVGLVGYLAFTAVQSPEPPQVTVKGRLEEARDVDGGWELPVIVRNDGGEAASQVAVEGTATIGGAEETAELEVDLLGAGTEEELVMRFSGAPEGDVELRIVGYHVP
jgi:uncharacterized protein (TIGR02588 family)